jgi:fluoroacetyl-CoA thioesterase
MSSRSNSFDSIKPGLIGEISLLVSEKHTAQHLGSGAVQVLATPQMVLLMEQASVVAVDHLLPEGYRTVGVHLDIRHLAPTPIDFEVRAIAELLQVEGRRLTFRVQVYEEPFDENGGGQLVGDGTHQRAIIDVKRFSEQVAQKASQQSDLP